MTTKQERSEYIDYLIKQDTRTDIVQMVLTAAEYKIWVSRRAQKFAR
jgi:hypothetical protein